MANKRIKGFFAIFVSAVLIILTVLTCNAAGTKIIIEQIDDMTIQLPDDMLGITRESKSTDKYFSVFGLDYDSTMTDFRNSDIFMQAMDNRAATTVTVTMTRNSDSEDIKNYKRLSDEKLYEVIDSFISQGEYISCTPDQAQEIVWLMFDLNVSNGSEKIKAFQANTVYDGMSINVTIQHNGGNVTPADYKTLQDILSTVTFKSSAAADSDFTLYIYIGIAALVVVLFIIVMAAGKKSNSNNKKKSKNDRIIRELSEKYKTSEKPARRKSADDVISIRSAYNEIKNLKDEDSSFDNDMFDDYKDIDDEEVNVKIYERPTVSDAEIDKIVSESKSRFSNEGTDIEIIETNNEPETERSSEESAEKTDAEEFSGDESVNEPEEVSADAVEETEEYVPESLEDDEEDYEYEKDSEEELRREAEKNTDDDFDEGYDFFEEKPRRIVGIIDVDSSDLKNAVDYDVLSEEEKRAAEVETADNDSAENFINAAARVGSSIKNFFVHCGYFCTNVARLIKRRSAAKKRKKAELERRERERIRRQQTTARRDENGLVKVHSANQRYPQSQSRAQQSRNQAMRKAPSRRPQQNGNSKRR